MVGRRGGGAACAAGGDGAGILSLIAGGGQAGGTGGKGREYGDVQALVLTPSGSYADARRLVCKVAAEAAKAAGLPTGV